MRSSSYHRYDRSISGDRLSGGDSYRSAIGHDELRRVPANQVNSLARKFENLASDSFSTRSPSTRMRDRSYDSYTNSYSSKYLTRYDEEARDTIAALPNGGGSIYRSRLGALSVPDVPSYAKHQVRLVLDHSNRNIIVFCHVG